MIHVELSTQLPTMSKLGMIDLDATAVISGIIFIGMLFLLNRLLFAPYLAITHERARLTTGTKASADATVAEADAVLAEYSERLAAARAEAASLRDDLRREGESDETRIVKSARDQAASALAHKRDALSAQVAEAEREIDARAATLSQVIVERVLS